MQQPFHYRVFICVSTSYNTIPYEVSCKISWFWPVYVKLEGIIWKIVIAALLMDSCGLQHANLHQIKKPA